MKVKLLIMTLLFGLCLSQDFNQMNKNPIQGFTSTPNINNQNIVSKLDQILEVLGERVNAPSSGFGAKDSGTGPIKLNIKFAHDTTNSSSNNNSQSALHIIEHSIL